MAKIFCISAGQLLIKKEDNKINKKNRYLNYGLLSLATELKTNGFDPIQLHGNFDQPSSTFEKCINFGLNNSSMPILISIPSFYAITWVAEFTTLIKERNKNLKIILGGRWVIADRETLMKQLIPHADIIISGLANTKIINIVNSCFEEVTTPSNLTLNKSKIGEYPKLDYSILFERKLYHPSIEVSRGCGMSCSFCQEKDEKLNPLKPPEDIINEAKSIILNDDLPPMNIYFEASMFVPNKKWIEKLIENKIDAGLVFKWRAEARVDSINPKLVPLLAKSGLQILDLGLESASKTQLKRMKKTRDPEKYLLRASKLLKEAYKHKICVKINILLTAGETEKTISTTIDWLDKHKKYIKGVSAGPVIVFGWESDTKAYIEELMKFGASISHSPSTGIIHLNLSKEINYGRSIEIANNISKMYMTKEDHFYLKSFSYFSREYTYDSYLKDRR